MMGATPPKFVLVGRTTFSAMPEATPASTALPPSSKMRKPAAAARWCPADTMWAVPMTGGR